MLIVLTIPFIVQALVISFDEYFFHIKRGLPKWERIGHPIDTLSVFLCFMWALCANFSPFTLKVYIGLAIVSCLLVTKDEFVHKHHCPASEQWLHALLFLNHPILLAAIGYIWSMGILRTFLIFQACFTALFFLYQVIYWNVIWQEEK